MIIGIDFDNTIVDYSDVFHSIALERGLIPEDLEHGKNSVRDYLRSCGKEETWIELQGIGYGPRIFDAKPFPGVIDFFRHCVSNGIKVYIISHKTLHPFLGEKHNLHDYAQLWLEKQGFYGPCVGLSRKDVFLELTKEKKFQRISEMGCTHFVDDLVEFLVDKRFPQNVMRILFDPNQKQRDMIDLETVSSWSEVLSKLK